jgi:hypothetical protein
MQLAQPFDQPCHTPRLDGQQQKFGVDEEEELDHCNEVAN